MEGKRLLLFDFDGVIADTFHIMHSLAKKLCVYVTESEYRKRFDGDFHGIEKELASVDHGDKCDHTLDWWSYYVPAFHGGARPFAGMPEIVEQLGKTYPLFIVSSCRNALIEDFFQKNQLRGAVQGIFGVDVNPKKSEKFEMICAGESVTPADCIFVTDTLGDINEAASVGLSSIGVTWGFQDRATLSRGNPFAIVDSPRELPAAVSKYFASI